MKAISIKNSVIVIAAALVAVLGVSVYTAAFETTTIKGPYEEKGRPPAASAEPAAPQPITPPAPEAPATETQSAQPRNTCGE